MQKFLVGSDFFVLSNSLSKRMKHYVFLVMQKLYSAE